MEKKIDYNEIIHRIGYFRTKANLSARETSLRLGYSEQFMKRIENKSVELKVSTLLDFLDIVDVTPQDFFYMGDQYNKEDKNVLDLYNSLSADAKQTIIDLMKKLK
ncbi:MAG: helix-turn-helix transcriptional regulator [Clostridia bacterium]|nr:helix-turn-helix transcriptional regulator [Clostridia bacterium]